MDDLYAGLVLQGTVRNVVDFGVHRHRRKQDGLLHRSQIPPRHRPPSATSSTWRSSTWTKSGDGLGWGGAGENS
ncbi:MAG: hypothetical protein R2851_10560 [Caldilineaceae bacterium]